MIATANEPRRATAVQGLDGWLFLSGDTNETMLYSTGQRQVAESTVRGWRRLLEFRHAWLAQRGIDFGFAIVPNKEAVYAEFLPDGLPPVSEDRLVRRLERQLAEQSTVRIEHLLAPLRDAATRREVYARTDTHWNGYGAFVGYRQIVAALAPDPANVLDEERVRFSASLSEGDLGAKLDPAVTSEFVHCAVRHPRARVVDDNGVVNNGRIRRTEWPGESSGPKLLVFHDSFYNWLLPLMAETFPVTVAVHNFQFDYDLIERERPDIVLGELTERFMVSLANDLTGTTTADFLRMKSNGDLPANH